jgi:hypothetical protein
MAVLLKLRLIDMVSNPNQDKVLIDKVVTTAQGNEYCPDYLHDHNKIACPTSLASPQWHTLHSLLLRIP